MPLGSANIDSSLLSNSGSYQVTATNKHGEVDGYFEISIVSDNEEPRFNSSVYSLQLFHGQSGRSGPLTIHYTLQLLRSIVIIYNFSIELVTVPENYTLCT